MQNKRFLTLLETAEYLNIKQSKVYELSARRDALPGKVKIDGVVRVDRLVLDEWIAQQTGGAVR